MQNIIEIIYILFLKEFKSRYKGHALGYLWALLLPLSQALIYYYVFKIILKVEMENFGIYMIAGIFPWNMISYSIIASTNSYMSNANLIKKVNFHKFLVPFSITINEMMFLYISLIILIPFLIFNGMYPTIEWLIFIPILSILTILFATSFGIILAIINVFFKDMNYIVTVYFNVMFFLTPIVYPIQAIPKYIEPYLFLNPFVSFIVSWRELFMYGTINYNYLFQAFLYTFFVMIIAFIVYKKYNSKIAEYV